ncbi:hypothetical protein [Duganella violaceipulchra]|uniref:Uncharacterized protein n=1 Tax=Duganella violaceipulchra TaxID=2849652 RepID=A0AA41L5N2_9BURK|nr:hypothetical protein [Duganella violaceicalia]MBV6324369.1 hypothetical protein [Duganella violaceicalia]MCP2007237.1 hypothetical protein [Duganella violaceicalia]
MTPQEAEALVREGAAIDAGAAAHSEAAASGNLDERGQIVAPDENARAMEWFMVPKVIAWAITAVFPETAPNYSDAKCMELAHAIVPVADKYGLSGVGDSPELMLLLATGMFCAPGYLAHKGRKEKAIAEEKARLEGGSDGSRE